MRFALYKPDIPQNAGAMLRLAACLGWPLDLIEPAGFHLDDRRLKRAGLDYRERASLVRHESWTAFLAACGGRLLLLTTGGETVYTEVEYRPGDVLLLGRESAGVPAEVHEAADRRLRIPIQPGARSLNLVTAAAMVAGEATRQLGLPATEPLEEHLRP